MTDPALTADDFLAWVEGASPGERLLYHRGLLACDMAHHGRPALDRVRLNRLASMVWLQGEARRVRLMQQRQGPDECAYYAERTSVGQEPASTGGRRSA